MNPAKRQTLPIGIDCFRELRRRGDYYVDKTLFIKEIIENNDKAALITRPRRFGKTLNMTMLRDFFDITQDSRAIFEGLAIMDTEYAGQINSKPVIYLTLKNCRGNSAQDLCGMLAAAMRDEYQKYAALFKDSDGELAKKAIENYEKIKAEPLLSEMRTYISDLIKAAYEFYKIPPILLIDEYEQPILSAYENGFRKEITDFFSIFLGEALKGNESLGQSVLTGIQRVVKESIFSQLNNIQVYTTLSKNYAEYFGLTEPETQTLLKDYGLELNANVKAKYDGYIFGGVEIYNPWSAISYAKNGELNSYWVNTSSNKLVRDSLRSAGQDFRRDYERLLAQGGVQVAAKLDTSFIELASTNTLWGLLVNAGYLTVLHHRPDSILLTVGIPNGEVRSEFIDIVAEESHVSNTDLLLMQEYLISGDIENFAVYYERLVMSYTSYYDGKENAYHMLMLGMCVTLGAMYKITSNIKAGYGRSDIRMESLSSARPHIVIEFKQGENIDELKREALNQILEQKYYSGLEGNVTCVGVAHSNKRCAIGWEMRSI